MKQVLIGAAVLILVSATAVSQPAVGGVANVASYAAAGLPNSGIAQGSMFVVFGQNMGPATLAAIDSFPLVTTFQGTSIKVTVGATTVDAFIIYTSAGQLAAVLPSNTPVGTGVITVTYNGRTSATFPITVVRSSFGIFTVNQAGSGPGIVQNVISESDRPVNALTRSARPRQAIIIWGTGLGAVSGNEAAGPVVADLPVNVEVLIGGKPARILYRGRSGCCAGIDQLVAEVPDDVEGCYVSVAVKIGDVVSNFVSMSISRSGDVCSDPNGFSNADLERARATGRLTFGYVGLGRFTTKLTLPQVGTIESKTDTGSGAFLRFDLNRLLQSAGGVSPTFASIGSCTVYTYTGDAAAAVNPVMPDILDAGDAINVTGPRGAKRMDKQQGFYSAQLGGGTSLPFPGAPPPAPEYLEPGTYTIDNGSGGRDVGPFRETLAITGLLTWANIDAISTVTRSQNLEVTWTGGDPGSFVTIAGSSTMLAPRGGAGFFCTAPARPGRFTVPSSVLLALPPSGTVQGTSLGSLSVSGVSGQTSIRATGLDSGSFTITGGGSKAVTYQ